MSQAHPQPRYEHLERLASGGTLHLDRPSRRRVRHGWWTARALVYRNRDILIFTVAGLALIAGLWAFGDPAHQHVVRSSVGP